MPTYTAPATKVTPPGADTLEHPTYGITASEANDAFGELERLSGVSEAVAVNAQIGTAYTLVLTDAGKVVEMDNAAANTVTVPPDATVAFPVGTVIEIAQVGAGVTTVVAGAGVTVNVPTSLTLALNEQYSSASLRKRAADVWLLTGDLEVA